MPPSPLPSGPSLRPALRLGLLHAFLALALGWLALGVGGLAWILLWPALAVGAIAAAYLVGSPRVFGKRRDGTLPLAARAFLLPYLAFLRGGWHVARWLSSDPPYHEVLPGLYLGRWPFAADLPKDATLVVDLTAEFESAVARTIAEYHCVPALDGHVPDADAFREAVLRAARHEGKVYVHCAAGRGRSASLAAAVAIARGLARSPEEAEALIRKIRVIRMSAAQRALIRAYLDAADEPRR